MANVSGAVDRLIKDLEYALSFVEAHKDNYRTAEAKAFLFEQIAKLKAGALDGVAPVAAYFAPTCDWDDLMSEDGTTQCAIGSQVMDSVRYLRWHQERQAFNDKWVARLKKVFSLFRS